MDVHVMASHVLRGGHVGGGARPGLRHLCMRVLRRELDKSQQCSAWQQRPLSSAQLAYAAADAHCLTAIFDALLRLQPLVLARLISNKLDLK